MATKGSKTKFYTGAADAVNAAAITTAVAGVLEVTPPKRKTDIIDVSTTDSVDDYRDIDAGWKEYDDAEVTLLWTPAVETAIATLVGTKASFKLVYFGGASDHWVGIITEDGKTVERKGVVGFTIKIAISAKLIHTAAVA